MKRRTKTFSTFEQLLKKTHTQKMKHLTALLLFVVSIAFQSAAQEASPATPNPAHEKAAREATDLLAAKYSLDADQIKQMYTIQLRKQRNTAEILPLQMQNPALYRAKVQSLRKGTLASIRRVMHTKEQVDLYQKTQITVRSQQADKRKTLMEQQATKDEIEAAMLDIYSE